MATATCPESPTSDVHSPLAPTDIWVRLILVPVIAFVALAGSTAYLADFWHHLARGRAIVAERQLLDHDVFTYTVASVQFQDVNWLTQVIYYALYERGGLALVQVVNALLIALTLGWLVLICRRLSGSLIAAMAVGIVTFLGLWQVLTIRPQTFSLLLFVALFEVLERSARRPGLLLLPPILLCLWANLHGAFPAGLILVGCFLIAAAGQAWRHGNLLRDPRCWALLACLTACVLATLVNPYGWNIYLYVGMTSNRAAARRIDEWIPPSLDQMIGIAFFASLAVVLVLGWLAWKRAGYRPGWTECVLGACFVLLAAGSVRMVAWWLLILAPVLAVLFTKLWPTCLDRPAAEYRPNRGAAISFFALVVIGVSSLPGLQAYNPLFAARPKDRVEHDLDAIQVKLREHMSKSRVFTRFEWGEYLAWSAHPDFTLFMDGRIEIYPDKVWQEYSDITVGKENWSTVLDHYAVNALILDAEYHAETGLLRRVEQSSAWRRVASARTAVLYVRR